MGVAVSGYIIRFSLPPSIRPRPFAIRAPLVRCVFPNTDCPGGANRPPRAAGREQVSANRGSLRARPLEEGRRGKLPSALSPLKAAGATPAAASSVPPLPFRRPSLVSCENARPSEGRTDSPPGAAAAGSLRELLTLDRPTDTDNVTSPTEIVPISQSHAHARSGGTSRPIEAPARTSESHNND